MNRLSRLSLFLFALALVSACTKEGPAGPEGPTGPQGPAGPGSAKGKTFTIAAANWTYTAPSWSGTISNADITQAIVDQGGVFVYWKKPDGNWVALPFIDYPTDWYSSTLQAEHKVGSVNILITDSELTQPISPGDRTFKVIAVSGDGMVRNPDLNWNNLAEVGQRFGLQSEDSWGGGQ